MGSTEIISDEMQVLDALRLAFCGRIFAFYPPAVLIYRTACQIVQGTRIRSQSKAKIPIAELVEHA